jgi:hypothetical protein
MRRLSFDRSNGGVGSHWWGARQNHRTELACKHISGLATLPDAQAFRAARLAVDSGLHAMGWARERAIGTMHERGILPMVDADIEVDRSTIRSRGHGCGRLSG